MAKKGVEHEECQLPDRRFFRSRKTVEVLRGRRIIASMLTEGE